MANPVMTEACAQAAIRMISFQEQMAQNGVSPATISELISSGVVVGEKRPITTKLLVAATVLLPNSLLASSGMLVANVMSASAQLLLRGTRETVKGTVRGARTGDFTDLKAHYRATLGLLAGGGSDAQVYRNAARFMYSTFVEGRASDINSNVASIARERGLKKSDVIKSAKNLLWTRFSEQNKLNADTPDIKQIEKAFKASFNTEGSIEIDRAAQDLFASSYDFSPKHAIFHDPGSVGKVNSIAKAIDFTLTVPSRLAIGVDETAKVFFRHQIISEQLYVDAIKANKTDPSKSVGEYYQEYSQELYGEFWNGYNSIPKGPNKNRYHNITKGLRMLEGKFDSMFLERGVSFNDLREQALQMTFQNQTSAFVKNADRSYKVSDEGSFIRKPSFTDKIAMAKNQIGPTSTLGEKVIAVGASSLAPFVKTPVNIVIEGMSYVPLVAPLLFNKSMRQKLKVRGYDTEDMLVRSAMGFTVLASLFAWMSEDDGTGMPKMSGIPVSYDERERWRLAGIPEQSIRIGDTWVPYGRVEPVAGLLAGLANAHYHFYKGNEKEYDDALIATVWGLTADKTYLGAIDFLDNFAYGSPSEGVQKAMNDYIKSYVPTASADIARAGDSERIALTSAEKIQQRIPGLRQELAPDYASIAEADKQIKGWEVFLKMKFPEASWTNLQREIYKTGVDINKPNRMFQGVELNSKELSLLRKVSQDKVTHGLSWLIETDYYKSLPVEERGPFLKQNVNSIRAALGPIYFREASKRENFGSTYFGGFMARKRNVEIIKRGQEGRRGLLEEPEYSPTK